MKAAILALLILSALIIGCATTETKVPEITQEEAGTATQEATISEVDKSLLAEEDIEIGEMI